MPGQFKSVFPLGFSEKVIGGQLLAQERFPLYKANVTFDVFKRLAKNTDRAFDFSYNGFGSLAVGADKYFGGCLAPNQNIYCSPMSSTVGLKINTVNDTLSTYGSFSGTLKWLGSCLAGDFIVHAPFQSTSILVTRWSDDSYFLTGNITGGTKYVGCVYAPDGWVYFIPYDATRFMRYHPYKNAIEFFGSYTGSAKHVGGCLYKNKIISPPYGGSNWLVLNFETLTYELVNQSGLSGTTKYQGIALAPNGSMYVVPHFTENKVQRFNPETYEIKSLGTASVAGGGYSGPCIGVDGNVYALPFGGNQSTAIKVDTKTDTFTETIVYNVSGEKWRGNVLAPNGKIYGVPEDITFVGTLGNVQHGIDFNFSMNRHFNKY